MEKKEGDRNQDKKKIYQSPKIETQHYLERGALACGKEMDNFLNEPCQTSPMNS